MNDNIRGRDASDSNRPANRAAWPGAAAALRRFRSWRRRVGLEATLRDMTDRALDDVGIVRGAIPIYARAAPKAPHLLASMLQITGVPTDTVMRRPDLRHALLTSCRACPNVAACERWLRSCTPADGYRTFCPNAGLIDGLSHRTSGLSATAAPQ